MLEEYSLWNQIPSFWECLVYIFGDQVIIGNNSTRKNGEFTHEQSSSCVSKKLGVDQAPGTCQNTGPTTGINQLNLGFYQQNMGRWSTDIWGLCVIVYDSWLIHQVTSPNSGDKVQLYMTVNIYIYIYILIELWLSHQSKVVSPTPPSTRRSTEPW